MIGRISGILIEKQPPHLLIDVNGIGYELQAPMTTFYHLPELGQKVTLYTHFVVREDGQALYGFEQRNERKLFRALIKVKGVGPKVALTILSGVSVEAFVQSIHQGDISGLVRVPGIGRKTAERMLVEMRDKLSDWGIGVEALTAGGDESAVRDATSALIALGYKQQDANRVIAKYRNSDHTSEELIRLALKELV